jgi:hypothetical protein
MQGEGQGTGDMVEFQHDIGHSWADAVVGSNLQRVDHVVMDLTVRGESQHAQGR